MESTRSSLTTAQIYCTATAPLVLDDIRSFYELKYMASLERMIVSQNEDMYHVSCVCKFGKRQQLYIRTVSERINGREVQAETRNFASRHLHGEFDRLWKRAVCDSTDPNRRVIIWSSPAFKKKSEVQVIAEMDDPHAALLAFYNNDPKKALGSGLATNKKKYESLKRNTACSNSA